MITIKANIKLYSGERKRTTAFTSGYRPLFDILDGALTSGMITLLDRTQFCPGDEGDVEITFREAKCPPGMKFLFFESSEPLGEGTVVGVKGGYP
jgi:elongation factor Tu